ncbi:motile sperm domain-containing protein 1-like [Chanos chanos]|uniref:Motile sperm domain-containing protein 1-like n=1 Tax=Chanos chanos TaxID=29144 RepID=A0A6J2VG20_CHACN|nr:motile sperm domain-containing protein 3 [Chanos chanos]
MRRLEGDRQDTPPERGEVRRKDLDDQLRRYRGSNNPSECLPVFVFPTELLFFSGQHSSHRRVLTLYNPYNFSVRFKMRCTSPSLYTVADAEGSVKACSCVDIVIRHKAVKPQHWGRKDRFRLDVWGGGQSGCREICAELRAGSGAESSQENLRDRFARPEPQTSVFPRPLRYPGRGGSSVQFLMYVVVGLVCVAVQMLPLQSEPSPMVPSLAHVTIVQKLVCAYVLGLLTMEFLW